MEKARLEVELAAAKQRIQVRTHFRGHFRTHFRGHFRVTSGPLQDPIQGPLYGYRTYNKSPLPVPFTCKIETE